MQKIVFLWVVLLLSTTAWADLISSSEVAARRNCEDEGGKYYTWREAEEKACQDAGGYMITRCFNCDGVRVTREVRVDNQPAKLEERYYNPGCWSCNPHASEWDTCKPLKIKAEKGCVKTKETYKNSPLGKCHRELGKYTSFEEACHQAGGIEKHSGTSECYICDEQTGACRYKDVQFGCASIVSYMEENPKVKNTLCLFLGVLAFFVCLGLLIRHKRKKK